MSDWDDSDSSSSEGELEPWAVAGDESVCGEADGVDARIAAVAALDVPVIDTTNFTLKGSRRTPAVALSISLLKIEMGIGQFTGNETCDTCNEALRMDLVNTAKFGRQILSPYLTTKLRDHTPIVTKRVR